MTFRLKFSNLFVMLNQNIVKGSDIIETVIMDGKALSQKIKDEIKNEVSLTGIKPGLAVIVVGDDYASSVYVKNKHRACEYVGFKTEIVNMDSNCSDNDVIAEISRLNADNSINGILVQLPLPKHLNKDKIISAISDEKDVDCFKLSNFGSVFYGQYNIAPCTPSGIIEILKEYNVDLCGKKCVVIGRSNIVGKPVASLLMEKNATVTVCHTKTVGLKDYCRNADIIVSAVGRHGVVDETMMKDGVVLIDVGINRNADGKLCGDIIGGEGIASLKTPVPGGIGPMTIAMLLKNTMTLYKKQKST